MKFTFSNFNSFVTNYLNEISDDQRRRSVGHIALIICTVGCPQSIDPGETRFGLTNDRVHTVMHCSCDERFRSCLKMVGSQAADIVGNVFFNGANPPCFIISRMKVNNTVTSIIHSSVLL